MAQVCFAQHCPALCCVAIVSSQEDAKSALVQEGVADQAKQYKASEGADVLVSKKGKLGNSSHMAKQNKVDDIFRSAEPDWQQLLL